MNPNNDPRARTSFFDDDSLQIQFLFKKFSEKSHQQLIEGTPLISGALIKQNPNQITLPQQTTFSLYNNTLIKYQKDRVTIPETFLDISHSRLKELAPTSMNPYPGFSLTKNGLTHEFYSPEKKDIESWVAILKGICVLLDFHAEYKAIKIIGKGSFAKVYLIESKTTGKRYAVKAFVKECFISTSKSCAKPSMINEITIIRALNHDNIIKLYEVYETDKSIYLVMELIEGRPLQNILHKPNFREKLTEAKLVKMIYSILDALAYLASKGIMHRDLKPDNILIDKQDKVKIADFGLATYIDIPEYIFKKCGTPGYIAPEVLKYDDKNSKTNYDHHCDAFSAGCILFYTLFGKPFFEGRNASEILLLNRKYNSVESRCLNTARTELNNPLSKISKEGIKLALQLLEFDPKKRMPSTEAVFHAYFNSMYTVSAPSLDSSFDDLSPKRGLSPNRGSFMAEHVFTSSSRRDSLSSPLQPHRDRFAERDSLYLDMGKPDFNGKIETFVAGYDPNSMLFPRRGSSQESSKEGSLTVLRSPETKKRGSQRASILKAAILKNVQKNSEAIGEEGKEEDDDPLAGRRGSDFSKGSPGTVRSSNTSCDSDIDAAAEVCGEDSHLESHIRKLKAGSPLMIPSMKTRFMAQNSPKQFKM